ncbi:MAG TPA: alpha/beta hydrolase [Pseudolabrys sp.]|nr:alpha/beta hydrolase [Pseudolabrys sp.]
MPPIDYEKEYDNRGRVPEHETIFAGMARNSGAYRAAARKAELGISYGPSARQIIDFFPAAGANAPLAVFIHGGYWRSRDPSSYSHFAKILNANGISVAVAGYDLAPQVSIADIIEQMRAACLHLWRKHKQRLFVFGHSAGGHLTACMLATDWKRLDSSAPPDLVPAAYAISGVFDLMPLLHVSTNADFKLNEASARASSPVYWKVPAGRIFDAVVGSIESDEFIRQTRMIADEWAKHGVTTRYGEIEGANHFTVVDPLNDPDSAMSLRLIELAKQVKALPL